MGSKIRHDVAQPRETLGERLVRLRRLAVDRVSAGADHARARALPAFGHVRLAVTRNPGRLSKITFSMR